MKSKLLLIFTVGIFLLTSPLSINAASDDPVTEEEIELIGTWDEKIPVSLDLYRPKAFLAANNIRLTFPLKINDLRVEIYDSIGNLVYGEVLSASRNSEYFLPCDLNEGEYVLILGYNKKVLSGNFSI